MEIKNIDDNIFLDPSSGELTFGKLFKIVKFSLLRMLIYVLIACIIAGTISLSVVAFGNTKRNVSTIISYKYDGIEKGLSPNGTPFDRNRIKNNPKILSDAIATAKLGKSNKELNSDILASHIRVEGIVPANILAQIEDLKSKGNKKPDANAQLEKIEYFPTRFMIYIDSYDKMGLSEREAITLLDEVIRAYTRDWNNLYTNNTIVSFKLFGDIVNVLDKKNNGEELTQDEMIIDSYEFTQYESLIKSEVDSLKKYLQSNKSNGFVSSTNHTYATLLSNLNNIEITFLNPYSQYINQNKIVKSEESKAILKKDLEEEKKQIDTKIDELTNLITETTELRSTIKPEKVTTPDPSGTGSIVEERYPEIYYDLTNKIAEYTKQKANYSSRKKVIEQDLLDFDSEVTTDPAAIANANIKLEAVSKALLDVAKATQQLSEEYKSTDSLSDAVTKVLPVTRSNEKIVSNTVILVVFVIAVLIAITAAIAVTYKSQKQFAIKKIYGKKNVSASNDNEAVSSEEVTDDTPSDKVEE